MRAHVAVGSNLGDRWAHLASAARGLRALPRTAVVRASSVHDTAPMGPVQPRFLNAVLELETALTPERLLDGLLAVEEAALRRREVHWGPRTLDLDLLLHGDAIRSSPRLTLPHPGLAARRFVLAPLAELVPDLAVPGSGRTVSELLALAPPHDVVRVGAYPL
ncbi:MAG TPA: 2-amino-4-hydroxy-6-hydroxymethyldihydropteridine diphosphokinase [Anaeromyxobacteraceae bacterium]|nr:2-amino-4-hydroxy-6-hydroxymethyldihydropteridine diphosphokinase [Anaeromyxobacteraceae bacterium]